MSATQKKKLCWNCEGRVSLEEENCPYCAVYLGPAPEENGKQKDLLTPPYRLVETEEEEEAPASPYTSNDVEQNEETPVSEVDLSTAKGDLKEVVYPLFMLSAGALFFVFSLVLKIFSDEGIFTLQWNGDNWHFYLFASLPMLFLGWRSIQKFDNE